MTQHKRQKENAGFMAGGGRLPLRNASKGAHSNLQLSQLLGEDLKPTSNWYSFQGTFQNAAVINTSLRSPSGLSRSRGRMLLWFLSTVPVTLQPGVQLVLGINQHVARKRGTYLVHAEDALSVPP